MDPKATGEFAVAGDSVSVKDVARIFEEVKKEKLTLVRKGSTDDLARWIEEEKAKSPNDPMPYVAMQYVLPMLDGRGKLHTLRNTNYPHIRPTTLKQYLQQTDL